MILRLFDAWRAPAPEPRRVEWLGQATYAHRGRHSPGVPENSPAAFAEAMAGGLGIECDVQRTGDGHAVVFHDWELDRLTDESGPLLRRPLSAIEGIVLSGGSDRIPSLERTLAQVGGRVPLLIELKSKRERRVGPLCLAVHRALDGYRGRHAVMSFDPRVSRWFSVHSPRTLRGLVVTEENDRGIGGSWRRHAALWHARPDFLAYDIRDLPSTFAAVQRNRGLPVLTWTVRDPDQRERAARCADAAIAEGDGLE